MLKQYLTAHSTASLKNLMSAEELVTYTPEGEFHTSLCYFLQDMVVYMQSNNGSVAGYTGEAYGDWFILDIDVEGDIDTATKTAISIIEYMERRGIEPIVFYSGKKGYHIYIDKNYIEYPSELNKHWNVAMKLFAKYMIEQIPEIADYLDLQLYTKTHTIRFPYSIHPGTNNPKMTLRYNKTELTLDKKIDIQKSFTWIPDKKESFKRMIFCNESIPDDEFLPSIDIRQFWIDSSKATKKERREEGNTVDMPNIFGKKVCIAKMKSMTPREGHRTNTAIRLVAYYREEGFSKSETSSLIRAWNDTLEKPIEDSIANPCLEKQILASYDKGLIFTCSDQYKMKQCSSKCFYFKTKGMSEGDCLMGGQMSAAVEKLKKIPTDQLINISLLWTELKRVCINPALGQVMTICAASGVGKTTILLNIMIFFRNINWLFLSYDMTKEEVAIRLTEIMGLDTSDPEQAKQFDERTKHIDIVDDAELHIDNVEAYYIKLCKQTRKKYACIAYDFLDYVPSNGHSDTEKNSYAAKKIRTIGKSLKIAQIMLTQVPKEKGGNGNIKIGQDAPMNAGNIVNISHAVLLSWRPFKGSKMEEDNTIIINPVKYRSGRSDYDVRLRFTGSTYTISNFGT